MVGLCPAARDSHPFYSPLRPHFFFFFFLHLLFIITLGNGQLDYVPNNDLQVMQNENAGEVKCSFGNILYFILNSGYFFIIRIIKRICGKL